MSKMRGSMQHLILAHTDPQENNTDVGSVDVACKEGVNIVLGT